METLLLACVLQGLDVVMQFAAEILDLKMLEWHLVAGNVKVIGAGLGRPVEVGAAVPADKFVPAGDVVLLA